MTELATGITVSLYSGETDGVPVVQIDTTETTGRIRVNLNDGPPLYDGNPEITPALAAADDHGGRTCNQCGDVVGHLSSRDWCDACEARPACDECGNEATAFYTSLAIPVQLCDACEHDAYRSGWTPGA